ncbi:hypothetical protein L2E82_30582 [Cichorium intybus]|uniref:Uncharacterized protein n=1 Tax=Cichorium intybus TaxID=13427 RepID=A0ACB9D0S2_CICIN|nr:hypothetical protein L2E82_30582 [Cichorium intybus]
MASPSNLKKGTILQDLYLALAITFSTNLFVRFDDNLTCNNLLIVSKQVTCSTRGDLGPACNAAFISKGCLQKP